MFAEFGHFALALAFALSVAQGVLPLIGAQAGHGHLIALSRPLAFGQAAFIIFAFAALSAAFLLSDFSVGLVAQHSHSEKPWFYKLAGVWGNHEGSMLLWVLILALYGSVIALFARNLPEKLVARVLSIQGLIGAGFLAFIIWTSNPFLRLDPAAINGNGLNPLLQDPGLVSHPPFLYLGYVGFSVAFSFAVAALIEGRVDPAWGRWVRPWTLAAWCFLTIGIMLGSVWAYYELGWGGWWYWDPVENASLMPWLAGTALLHSAIVVERRDALKRWTILLAILTFTLSLIGTFLVRSGVVTSVHSFAVDPSRGVFILALLLAVTGGAFTLYAIRAPQLRAINLFAPVSRESSLVLNNVFLVSLTGGVFVCTFYSLFARELYGTDISAGAPVYNLFFVPLSLALMVIMAIGPILAWKRGNIGDALNRLKIVAAIAIGAGAASLVYFTQLIAAIPFAIAVWLCAASVASLWERIQPQRGIALAWEKAKGLPGAFYGASIAHAGVAITALGIIVSVYESVERVDVLKPGGTIVLAGYDIKLVNVTDEQGPNYTSKLGQFEIRRHGRLDYVLAAEKRNYPNPGSETTEAGLGVGLTGVVYVALGSQAPDGGWVVRSYFHPLITWIWGGATLMALGGIASLRDRRLRIGAPRKASTIDRATNAVST